MKKYFKYFQYVVKHKWFVFLACAKQGLIWRGLVHDLSKFSPREFFPYARMFYGDRKPIRDSTGYYDPYKSDNLEFKNAWLEHLHKNKHHWQHFCLVDDSLKLVFFEMPTRYIKELLADWIGAGKAQRSKYSVNEWYDLHKQKIQLHSKTREKLEKLLKNES